MNDPYDYDYDMDDLMDDYSDGVMRMNGVEFSFNEDGEPVFG